MIATVATFKISLIRLAQATGVCLFLALMAMFVSANLFGYVPSGAEGIFCQNLSLDEDFSPDLLQDRALTTAHFDGGTGFPGPAPLRDDPGTAMTYARLSASQHAVSLFFEIPDGARKGQIMRRDFAFDGCAVVIDRSWEFFARESNDAALYRRLLGEKAAAGSDG